MNTNYASISVYIVTYNQEKIISRTINSVLKQREYGLKKIVICDDCSTDNNWGVIKEFEVKYPDIIMTHRNQPNKGIYGNYVEAFNILKNLSTDLIMGCEGDDEFCDGFLKAIQETIVRDKVDIKNYSAAFYADFIQDYDKRPSIHVNQNVFKKGVNPIDLKLRHSVTVRSSAITRKCFERFNTIPLEHGLCYAEDICDLQQFLYSDKNYYVPVVGSIYHAGIGISTRMVREKYYDERIFSFTTILKKYTVSKTTKLYLYSLISIMKYAKNKFNVFMFIKAWYYYIVSLNFIHSKIGIRFMIGAIIRPLSKE